MNRCYNCGTLNPNEAKICGACDRPLETPISSSWTKIAGFGLLAALISAPLLWLLSISLGQGSINYTSMALVLGVIALLVGFVTYRLSA